MCLGLSKKNSVATTFAAEALRCFKALLSGQLVTALEELKTKAEEPLSVTDIHAIKAGTSTGGVGEVEIPVWVVGEVVL